MAVYVRSLPSVRVFTAQCTHVHWAVDDGKFVEKNWKYADVWLGNTEIDVGGIVTQVSVLAEAG